MDDRKIYTAIGFDFETSGLDCKKHACMQLAMQAVRLDTWKVIDRFKCYIYPYSKQDSGNRKKKVLRPRFELFEFNDLMEYQEEALKYNNITMDTLYKSGFDIKEVGKKVIEFVKDNTLSKGADCKPFLIGQNAPFDIGFLQQLMNYADLVKEFEKVFAGKVDYYGNFQPHYVDTIDLGKLAFSHDNSVLSYKLEHITELLGVELIDAHDADADVTATLNVTRVYSGRLRSNEGGGILMEKTVKSREHFKI